MYYAEYLREGETFLFREGRTRGFGQIVKLDSLPPPDLPPITTAREEMFFEEILSFGEFWNQRISLRPSSFGLLV